MASLLELAHVFSPIGKKVGPLSVTPSLEIIPDVTVSLTRSASVGKITKTMTESHLEVADINMSFGKHLFPPAVTFPVPEFSSVLCSVRPDEDSHSFPNSGLPDSFITETVRAFVTSPPFGFSILDLSLVEPVFLGVPFFVPTPGF